MDLGLHYWNFSTPGDPQRIADTIAAAAKTTEDGGFAEFSVMDHYFQIEQRARAEKPMLEAYSTLGYVAALTKRMRLAVMVTGVMYRYPGLLAKIVTTLDALWGGRAQLGLGASWYEREQRGLGVSLVPAPERFERLEETLQICLQMWSNNNRPYVGKPLIARHPKPVAMEATSIRQVQAGHVGSLLQFRERLQNRVFAVSHHDVHERQTVLCGGPNRLHRVLERSVADGGGNAALDAPCLVAPGDTDRGGHTPTDTTTGRGEEATRTIAGHKPQLLGNGRR